MTYPCILLLMLILVFISVCPAHLINTTFQVERPDKDIRLDVDKQTVNIICPNTQCPACPQCESAWLRLVKCIETKPTQTTESPTTRPQSNESPETKTTVIKESPSTESPTSKTPVTCPEVTCPDVTPCPTSPTTTSPEPLNCKECLLPSETPKHPLTILDLVNFNIVIDGDWIVFQRRTKGDVDFFRGWANYKKGFGDVKNGDFWLGNQLIHQITSAGNWELRVEITHNARTYFALYSNFSVASEEENYRLTVGDYIDGTAGDDFTYHNTMDFTTKDRDNDKWPHNCAVFGHGGWWYRSCHYSNLNGQWKGTGSHKAMRWSKTTGGVVSATSTTMKMRPSK